MVKLIKSTLFISLFTLLQNPLTYSQVADRLLKPNNTLVDTINPGIVTVTVNPLTTQQPSMYSVNKNLLKWNTSQIRGLRDTIINIGVNQGFVKKSDTASMLFPYLRKSNFTWTNLLGKPTFSTVSTSGDYNDLINKPNLSLYYLSSNPSGYISSINSSMITGALGYIPYNGTLNPNSYISSESDPIFVSSVSSSITNTNILNWNSAYSWGNHTGLYPLLSGSYNNPSWINSLSYSKITGAPTIYSFAGTSSQYTKGDGTYATLDKSAVGLSNVDNTSDLNKPISTSTQSALNFKQNAFIGSTSEYVRGDGSLASFPVNNIYSNGFGISKTGTEPSATFSINTADIMTVNRATDSISAINNKVNGKASASTTLTINGVTQNLSTNRIWTVGDILSSGTYSNPVWLTSLSWSKITGVPTTLSGYGITDGVTSATLTSALSSKENTITAGTTAQYWRGDKTWQTLDKTVIGLTNVDNTSDLNKPISNATQTALNSKQATLVSGTNIKTIGGVSLLGSGDITLGAGTITSVTAGVGLSGGTITTTGTISMPNIGTVGTYNTVTTDAQGRVVSGFVATPTSVTRPINSTSFQPSTTQATRVKYTITHTIGLTLLLSSGSTMAYLETSPNNSTWTLVDQCGLSEALAVAVVVNKTVTNNMTAEVLPGYYVRIRTVTSGGGSASYTCGQETTY